MFSELTNSRDFSVISHGWNRKNFPSLNGKYHLSDFLTDQQLAKHNTGEPTVVTDTELDEHVNKERYAALGIRSFIMVPLLRNGEWEFILSVIDNKPRNWRADEIELLKELTERIWVRFEKAKAETALFNSEERLRLAVDAGHIGTCDWNYTTGEMKWNEGRFAMYGLQPADRLISVKEFFATLHPDDADQTRRMLITGIEEMGEHQEEYRVVHPDGSIHWIFEAGRVVEWMDKKPTRVISVVFDITERKKLEQQKEDFIGIASHELKTPLTSMKMYSELLMDMVTEGNFSKAGNFVAKMDMQINAIIKLVHTLLDITKMAEGQLPLNFEPFDFNELAHECAEDLQRLSATHHIIIEQNAAISVHADRDRIKQVITNFLSNAIKYSPKGGDIRLGWEMGSQGLEVHIQDEGIGIAADEQMRVFERFFRANNAVTNTFPGMGLGLFISAGIIHRHGGKIWVKSEPGKGAIFYFTLPGTQ